MDNEKIEKLRGLYSVYHEVKNNYPNKQKLIDINWDDSLGLFEQEVIDSESLYDYYKALMKYISLVGDGHTTIMPPWMINPEGHSKPAIELTLINNQLVVSRVGNVKELKENKVTIGKIITHIDDVPVLEALESINEMYARGSKQANNKINTYFLLLGDASKKVSIKFKDFNDFVYLTRTIKEKDGNYFIDRFIDFDNPYTITKLDKDIYYVNILSFSTMDIADSFIDVLKGNSKGIIIDLRLNLGGNDQIASKMISYLIKDKAYSPIWRCELTNQAFQLWGKELPIEDVQNIIEPVSDIPYLGKVVILTSGMTSSTAEDMVITLKHSKRATIIGTKTAGSSGNPKNTTLPYGGTLRVSSFTPLTPNHKEYLGVGIEPDIVVEDTIESIKRNGDIVLDTAIGIIRR